MNPLSIQERAAALPPRIVQYKMILKCASFPIQNDPESWDLPRCQVDADSHGKRRSAEAGKNRGFSGRQCRDRFHRTDAHGTICVDSEGIGGAAVLLPAQEAARRGARVGEQGRRIKHAASDAADSSVSARRGTPSQPRGAAALSGQVHRGGCRAVGRGRPCASAAERAGDAPDSATRVAGVRPAAVRSSGGDFRRAPLQPAGQRGLPAARRRVLAHGSVEHRHRRAAQAGSAGRAGLSAGGHGAPARQADWEGEKGVYHVNAVDTVTQWEIVGCAARISEQHLLPVLEAMLHQFPFRILGFHADNGSEYVNYQVAEMLEKLMVEFTRSRPNRSSDNALVEGKNGAVIRKHLGYGHIASEHAERIQAFYTAHFNPYLNYHRPCGFAQVRLDPRGRRRRSYPRENYATPYEKFRSLPEAYRHLKEGMRWELLDRIAYAHSDTAVAPQMAAAKTALLDQCKLESPFPPRFACRS